MSGPTQAHEELVRALQCLYVQVPQEVADDVRCKVNARLDELGSALRPFAEAAPYFEQRYLDADIVYMSERKGQTCRIQVGDVRRAKAVLYGPPTTRKWFTDDEWKRMTSKQKREFWNATDYGRRRPPDELMLKLRAELEAASAQS